MRASVSTSWLVGASALCGGLLFPSAPLYAQGYDEPEGPVTHIDEAPEDEPAAKSGSAPPPPPEPESGSAEADQEARTLFEQGRVAFEEGRYRDSWDYFHRAYRLSRRPKLLYNVGQAADRLRKDREALEAFRLYLKHVPDAENRQEVEARVRALEAQLAKEEGGGEELEEGADAGPEYVREGETEDPAATPRAEGQPTRTGWYLRLAGGLGLMSDAVSGSLGEGTLSSLTAAGEVGIGYPVIEELVVGGMLIFDVGLAPKFEGVDVDSARLGGIGAFVDYYLDPRNDGWHVGGGIALMQLAKKQSAVGVVGATAGSDPAGGVALVASGGYEWAVADAWAIGPVGRITLAKLTEDSFDHTAFVLSVMFGATWF